MHRQIKAAVIMVLMLTALTGVLYPLAVLAVAQVVFPHQAHGSLIVKNGTVIGSELIGQRFSGPGYFHSRPSAAGETGYDASASGGSNLGPTNARLIKRARQARRTLRQVNPDSPVPIELVTTSGSGLDPDLSPAGAAFQIPRVARNRGVTEDDLRRIVRAHTKDRQLGLLGEPRVNVLELNLALDKARDQAVR